MGSFIFILLLLLYTLLRSSSRLIDTQFTKSFKPFFSFFLLSFRVVVNLFISHLIDYFS
jgi:hypothetical protein